MKIDPDFALKIRQALNDGANRLDDRTLSKLKQARKAALTRFNAAPSTVSVPVAILEDSAGGVWGWMHRVGFAIPLLVLVVGFVSIYQWREAQRIDYLTDIDFAVLLDDGPIDAYADKGFGSFIQQEPES